MNIKKIVVISTSGPLAVFLHTDLPGTTWPYNNNLVVKFELSSDAYKGGYLDIYFSGIPIEFIDGGGLLCN